MRKMAPFGRRMEHSPGFERLVAEVKPRIRELSVTEVRDRMQNKADFVLLDVREQDEWAAGRIPGALYLGRGVLERDIETRIPDQQRAIALYCGGGYRSALAADNLQKMGYTNVFSMAGGIRAWRAAGLPEERS